MEKELPPTCTSTIHESSEEKHESTEYLSYKPPHESMDEDDEEEDDETTERAETEFMEDDEHQATMLKLYYPKHTVTTMKLPKHKFNLSKSDHVISPDLLRMRRHSESTAEPSKSFNGTPVALRNAQKNVSREYHGYDDGKVASTMSREIKTMPHIIDNATESRLSSSFNYDEITIPDTHRKYKIEIALNSERPNHDEDEADTASDRFATGFIVDGHTQNSTPVTMTRSELHHHHEAADANNESQHRDTLTAISDEVSCSQSSSTGSKRRKYREYRKKDPLQVVDRSNGSMSQILNAEEDEEPSITISRTNSQIMEMDGNMVVADEERTDCEQENEVYVNTNEESKASLAPQTTARPVPIIRRLVDVQDESSTDAHGQTENVSRLFSASGPQPRYLSISMQSESELSGKYNFTARNNQGSKYYYPTSKDKPGALFIPQPRASQIEKTQFDEHDMFNVRTPSQADSRPQSTPHSKKKKMIFRSHSNRNPQESGSRDSQKLGKPHHRDTKTKSKARERGKATAKSKLKLQHKTHSKRNERATTSTPNLHRAKSLNPQRARKRDRSRGEPPIHSYNHYNHIPEADEAAMEPAAAMGMESEDESCYSKYFTNRASKSDLKYLENVIDHFWRVIDIASNKRIPFEILKISLRVKSIDIKEKNWDILLNELTNFQPSKNITLKMFKDFVFDRKSNNAFYYRDSHIISRLRQKLIVGLLSTDDHQRHRYKHLPAKRHSKSKRSNVSSSSSRSSSSSSSSSSSRSKSNRAPYQPANREQEEQSATEDDASYYYSNHRDDEREHQVDEEDDDESDTKMKTIKFNIIPAANSNADRNTNGKASLYTNQMETQSKPKTHAPSTRNQHQMKKPRKARKRKHQRSPSGFDHRGVDDQSMDDKQSMETADTMDTMEQFGGRELTQFVQEMNRKQKRTPNGQLSSRPIVKPHKFQRGRSSSHHSLLQPSSLSTESTTFETYESRQSNQSHKSNQSYLKYTIQHSIITSLLYCYDNALLYKFNSLRFVSYLNHYEWRKAIRYLLRCHFAYITDNEDVSTLQQFKFALYDQCNIRYQFDDEILPVLKLNTDNFQQYVITEHSYIEWMLKYVDEMVYLRSNQSFKDEQIEKLLTIVCYEPRQSAQNKSSKNRHQKQKKVRFDNPFVEGNVNQTHGHAHARPLGRHQHPHQQQHHHQHVQPPQAQLQRPAVQSHEHSKKDKYEQELKLLKAKSMNVNNEGNHSAWHHRPNGNLPASRHRHHYSTSDYKIPDLNVSAHPTGFAIGYRQNPNPNHKYMYPHK